MRNLTAGDPGYGFWCGDGGAQPVPGGQALQSALLGVGKPVFIVMTDSGPATAAWGRGLFSHAA